MNLFWIKVLLKICVPVTLIGVSVLPCFDVQIVDWCYSVNLFLGEIDFELCVSFMGTSFLSMTTSLREAC